MKILVLDNYDSFTYNLVHILREFECDMDIYRNDKIDLEAIDQYDKILLSPGPGIPEEAGIMLDVIKTYAPKKPILGVCLGHQGIAESFGGKLSNMPVVLHGLNTPTKVVKESDPLFEGIPNDFMSARYHSWTVEADSIQDQFEVLAVDEEDRVMAIKHNEYDTYGVQFHPESIITEHGKTLMKNWLDM